MQFFYDNINNYSDNDYQKMYNNLSITDKNKTDKLLKNVSKKQSILSKYLLRSILSQKYHLDYNNIYYSKFNKPLIKEINFNISHSFNYVVLIFSEKEIGIDIEKIRKVNLNIINSFCTDREKAYILNSNDIYKSLFEIYTLKEAYFKMLGTNLFNIKNIEFNIDKNTITSSISNLNIKLNYDISGYIIAIIEKVGN